MSTKYIIGAVAASFAVSYVCDLLIADKKIFGGKTSVIYFLYSFVYLFSQGLKRCLSFDDQVPPQALYQTRNGGKRLTRSSKHGLVLLDLLL